MTHPPGSTRKAGEEAEAAACAFLEDRGLRIVERNFRARGGEIDIVAREKDVLVFIEVRFREEEGYGTPEESVGPVKRRKIVSAARAYLGRVPWNSWKEARFDVIAVVGTGPDAVLRHYTGAFDARGKLL
jgi:putative endonuclease